MESEALCKVDIGSDGRYQMHKYVIVNLMCNSMEFAGVCTLKKDLNLNCI